MDLVRLEPSTEIPSSVLSRCAVCRSDLDNEQWWLVSWTAHRPMACLLCGRCHALALAIAAAPPGARRHATDRVSAADGGELDPWDAPGLLLLVADIYVHPMVVGASMEAAHA